MANELMTKAVEFEVNGEPVKLSGNTVQQYLVRGNAEVTEQEIVMFINLCKYQKLNPFLNEAYLVKFKGAPAQIIVSKEAFMKRAEANENYAGMEAGIIVERDTQIVDIEGAIKLPSDNLIGGWARVFRNDRTVPVKVRISFEEFSKGQATWKQMPMNMIRKTAIVNAMREAFPGNLGNMYTEEEGMPTDNVARKLKEEVKKHANKQIIDVQPIQVQEDPPEQNKDLEYHNAESNRFDSEYVSEGPSF